MATRLYVGNLSYSTTSEALRAAFEAEGRTVKDATIIMDRATGQSRGFGFVEMGSPAEASEALAAMDGRELDGRTLRVSEARERAPGGAGPRPPRGPRRGPGSFDRGGPPPQVAEMMGPPPDLDGGRPFRKGFEDDRGTRRERERRRGGGRRRDRDWGGGGDHDDF